MNAVKLFSVIIVSFFLVGCSPKGQTPPKAVKGVLDLRDWDFDPSKSSGTDGVINLDGEWEFYWKEFPVGESLELPEDKRDFIQVPKAWNGHIVKRTTESGEVIEETLGGEGYATYRLKVLLKEDMDLGLRVPSQATSYELYLNNKILDKLGIIGTSKDNSYPDKIIKYIKINTYTKNLEIYILISNFHSARSGLWKSIQLGLHGTILNLRVNNISKDIFISGILFIMGLYHFSLYYLRREDISPFYFGIFCMLIFIRTLIMGESYLNTLFPNLNLSWSYTIEFLTICLGTPVFIEFMYSLFPNEINKNIKKFILYILLIISLNVVVLPSLHFTKILIIIQIILILSILYGIYILFKAYNNHREGSNIFLIGFIFFSLSMINDILFNRNIINTGLYAPAGLVAFIFFQSYLLSSRFSKAFTDAKEQRQLVQTAKEEIERLNRTKDEFLANLSHEIKTPLVTIYGYSEMITLEENLPESTKEYGREIYKSATHLNSYMDDVLLVTDLETNLQLDKKPILFSELLKDSLRTLEPFLQEKNILPEVSDLSGIIINCDTLLFGRALGNVLKNGIVYNQADGTLKIRAEKKGQGVQISVVDSGIGISSEYHIKIFEKFFRIDSNLSYEVSGVGLGLFLAKKILELHGGSISVRSELGQGSEFVIEI